MSQPLVFPKEITTMLRSFAPVFTKPSFGTFCHYVGVLMLENSGTENSGTDYEIA